MDSSHGSTAAPLIDSAYNACRALTRRHARNFYYGFLTLPLPKRQAIWSVYAFCRLADDIADDDTLSDATKAYRLRQLSDQLDAAYDGKPDTSIFVALADTVERFPIPRSYFHDLMEGIYMDLEKTRYGTFEQLEVYCYRVASVVGLICLEIFGYSEPHAKAHAIELGLAMQLTNILRDVREDLDRDRIYLPMDELAQFGLDESDLRQGEVTTQFRDFMRFQISRARDYYISAEALFPFVDRDARLCPLLLHTIYQRILDHIEVQSYDVFSRRISPSKLEKVGLTVRAWTQSRFLSRGFSHDSLAK